MDTTITSRPAHVMQSTEVPATTVHDDGTTTDGTLRIVHAPDAPLPITAEVPCSPRCRCRS